jgi:DNA-binding transcriptional LysR family regulator
MTDRLSNLDLNLLVPLQALLRERHVSRAAAQLGLTQSAMSHALGRIRRVLNDEVLVRTSGGYQLTARAESISQALDDALSTIEEGVLLRPAFDPDRSSRRFSVAASTATSFVHLRPLIASTAASARRISFVIHDLPSQVDAAMRTQDLDLLLVPDVLPTEHPRVRLYEESWSLVVSADNDDVGEILTLDDLKRAPRAVFESGGLRTHAELALTSAGPHSRSLVVSDDFLLLFHLIAGTRLVGCVQTSIALVLADRHGLRIVGSPIPLPSFGIDMVVNPRRLGDPATQWFAQQLRDAAAGQPVT